MRRRSPNEHSNNVDRYDAFSRVMVGQVLNVDPNTGLLNVQLNDIPLAVEVTVPIKFSANGVRSSWARYMPEAFTYVKVAFDPNNRPKVVGFELPGSSDRSVFDGGYQLKNQLAAEGKLRAFRPLQLGEHDLRSSGGAGYYFTRDGRGIIEAQNLSVTLDANTQSVVVESAEVVRIETYGSAIGVDRSGVVPNVGSMSTPERVVVRVGAQLPTGVVQDAYKIEAGDLRDALGSSLVGPGAGFTRMREQAWNAAGAEVFTRQVDTTGAFEQSAILSQSYTAPRIILNAGGPADDVAVRGRALSLWLTTQLSVATAFGPSGPALMPLREGVELSATLEIR
jgi:hypothetical protein